jgi:hypothetical protein
VSTIQNVNINTILSNDGGCCVELIHNACDPTMWIIQRSKKILWFRFNRSTFWFFDKLNALTFAKKQADDHRMNREGIRK